MSETSKPKRRNSEKRKEKSRDAARCRRGQETEIFSSLASQLPVSQSLLQQIDKASIIRLSIAHIRLRSLLANVNTVEKSADGAQQKIDQLFYKSLDGFVLVVAQHGDIIYVSENVEKYLGLTQVDVLGHTIFDFTHPCDHDELNDLIYVKTLLSHTGGTSLPLNEDKQRGVFVRMKCTLTSKGRNINIKSASYKVISLSGCLLDMAWQSDDAKATATSCAVLIGRPIPDLVNSELALDERTFVSRLSMDLRFTHCDDEVTFLLGYSSDDLKGKSLFRFHHAFDSEMLDKSYKSLFVKGQSATGLYRFLAKHGGYVWMETQASIIGEVQSERSRSILCINHVISSEIECEDEILADIQLTQQHNTMDVVSESAVIEDDADEVIVYDDEDEEDGLAYNSGMQLVTEKLLGVKVLPYLNLNSQGNVTSAPGIKLNKASTEPIVNADQQEPPTADNTYSDANTMPVLDILLDDLECGLEMRAPYIPMDDLFFGSSPSSLSDDQSVDSGPVDLTSCPPSSVDMDLMNTLLVGCDTTTKQSLMPAITEASVGSKRPLDSEQQVLKLVFPASGYKLVKLDNGAAISSERSETMVTAVAQDQPAGVNNSSSVLMNLLTTGVDTNYGYRLSKPVHQLAEVNSTSDYDTSSGMSSPAPTINTVFLCQLFNSSPTVDSSSGVNCLADSDLFYAAAVSGHQASQFQLTI